MSARRTPTYDDRSITSLKGADRVRKRPAVMFGSDGLEGCEHAFFEILSNAVDEAREGYGDKIIVTAFADHSIEVEDFGRGVPLGYNEREQRYNWELIFCELYAGGKYNNNETGSAYEFSLGLNGLGACATQYASEYMEVQSVSNGVISEISFKRGEAASELRQRPADKRGKKSGTTIRWKPDREVFTDINIPREYYRTTLLKQAVVNAGLRFIFKWQKEDGSFDSEEFYYENGIYDYISEIVGEEDVIAPPVLWSFEAVGRDRQDKDDYKLKAQIAFAVSNRVNMLEYYHNSSFLEHGGSPDRAVRTAFTYAVDNYLKNNGKYTKNESRITFADIEDCLVLVTNSYSTQTSYENQTKKAISNKFIAEAMTNFLKEQLEVYFAENKQYAEAITGQVLINKRSREQAESARITLKKKLTGSMDVASRVDKFVACRSKDPQIRELYIVEGDSALTSCKLARNAEFQAIIPVRGKTLNCMKSTYDKIFKSEIITDLLKVIGCGVEIKAKGRHNNEFDYSALRWSKIIICTDADEDGFQIRTLILTMFYRLLPTLIDKGHVYIAESPLYEITERTKEERTYFAYNETEKIDIISKLDAAGIKYTLQRSKGLGENEPEMMWQTTMNPQTRRLIRVSPADAAETLRIFETLLGDDLPARKVFITENGHRYLAKADI
ncbi:MAG TPA: toprim domain-containing protein [Bacillota bacterium]|nr:toprim domain-containing protein [Bacillota bacterium]